jgi:hypothetical protein
VNYLSQIIVELSGLDGKPDNTLMPCHHISPMPVFHAVNPSVTPWSTVLPAVISHLGPSVSVVPWETWLSVLEASSVERVEIEQNTGIKLLDFYEASDRMEKAGLKLPVLETEISGKRSGTLMSVGAVTEQWMEEWMRQWNF